MFKTNTILLLLFIPHFSSVLFSQSLEKIIIDSSNVYLYAEPRGPVLKLLKVSSSSVDTVFKYSMPGAGFEHNPACWDVLNTKVILAPIFSDNKGFANAKLFHFDIDSLINLSENQAKLTAYYYRNRPLSSSILPFEIYNTRIFYHSDTLRGKLFTEFTCSRDSFLFYIYIDGQKKLEKWQYTSFSRALGYSTPKDTVRQKAWIKLNEYKIDFSGPFRTFAANHNNYLITKDGRIMLILADSIKETGHIADLEQKVLVFDRDRNQLRTIRKKSLESIKGPLSPEAIHQKSKLVIDFNR